MNRALVPWYLICIFKKTKEIRTTSSEFRLGNNFRVCCIPNKEASLTLFSRKFKMELGIPCYIYLCKRKDFFVCRTKLLFKAPDTNTSRMLYIIQRIHSDRQLMHTSHTLQTSAIRLLQFIWLSLSVLAPFRVHSQFGNNHIMHAWW